MREEKEDKEEKVTRTNAGKMTNDINQERSEDLS